MKTTRIVWLFAWFVLTVPLITENALDGQTASDTSPTANNKRPAVSLRSQSTQRATICISMLGWQRTLSSETRYSIFFSSSVSDLFTGARRMLVRAAPKRTGRLQRLPLINQSKGHPFCSRLPCVTEAHHPHPHSSANKRISASHPPFSASVIKTTRPVRSTRGRPPFVPIEWPSFAFGHRTLEANRSRWKMSIAELSSDEQPRVLANLPDAGAYDLSSLLKTHFVRPIWPLKVIRTIPKSLTKEPSCGGETGNCY